MKFNSLNLNDKPFQQHYCFPFDHIVPGKLAANEKKN